MISNLFKWTGIPDRGRTHPSTASELLALDSPGLPAPSAPKLCAKLGLSKLMESGEAILVGSGDLSRTALSLLGEAKLDK